MPPKSCPPMGSNPMCIGPDRYESLYHSQVQSFLSETLHHHTRERKRKRKRKRMHSLDLRIFHHHLNQVALIGFCNNEISFSSSNVCCCCCCPASSIGPNAKIIGSPRPAGDGSDTHPKLSSTGLLIRWKLLCIGSPLLHCLAANLGAASNSQLVSATDWELSCVFAFSPVLSSRESKFQGRRTNVAFLTEYHPAP